MLKKRIQLAFRLGWILAEVYGRLTQPNIRWKNLFPPPSGKPVTRLALSTRQHSNGESLWISMQMLVYLTLQLYPLTETTDGEQKWFSNAIQPPESIRKFIDCSEQVMIVKQGNFCKPEESFFSDFNHWSREILAVLNAENSLLAEAATLGSGLADTYWQWRLSKYNPKKQHTWEKLLNQYRLRVMIIRVEQIERYLPRYVGSLLCHSLQEVGKASKDEKLIQRIQQEPEFENNFKKDFKKQFKIWESLMLNRPLLYHLNQSDWRIINLSAIVTYILLILIVVASIGLIIYLSITFLDRVIIKYIDQILKWLLEINEFNDQLKLATIIITTSTIFLTQLWRIGQWLVRIYSPIYNWFLLSALFQKTCYVYNYQTKKKRKKIIIIWLERLLSGDNYRRN